MNISVYSDGSAQTAPNPGGWGVVVLIDEEFHKELSGHIESATNNDAELIAAIQGLRYVSELFGGPESKDLDIHKAEITLISDSEIVLNWANGKYKFKQVSKISLYNELRLLMTKMKVKTQWVRGHSGDRWNSRCDKLANNARTGADDILASNHLKKNSKIGSKKNSVVSLWYDGKLKIIDFDTGIVEDYSREVHGKRGSMIEIRKGKER